MGIVSRNSRNFYWKQYYFSITVRKINLLQRQWSHKFVSTTRVKSDHVNKENQLSGTRPPS